MARYIDADKFKSYVDSGHLRSSDEICISDKGVINMIDNQPTADVKDIVRGKWVYDCESLTCSMCGFCPRDIMDGGSYFSIDMDHGRNLNYCPDCGADMRGGE